MRETINKLKLVFAENVAAGLQNDIYRVDVHYECQSELSGKKPLMEVPGTGQGPQCLFFS